MAGRKATGIQAKMEAHALSADGASNRSIAKTLGVAPSTVGTWLADAGVRAVYQRSVTKIGDDSRALSPVAPPPHSAPSPVSSAPSRDGPLGLTDDTERAVGDALVSATSTRTAAWHAGLVESDVESWIEEAARGREPWASAVRRIRHRVAAKAIELAAAVASGTAGYQARSKALAKMDPMWSDRPDDVQTEGDRAAGLSDEALDACIAASDADAAAALARELEETAQEALAQVAV